MELSQLRYFLRVAEQQNFTRASEELGITQPALSRSIAKLESELGQPLFERQSRNVVLTDAGRQLLARAEQILALADDTLSELSDNAHTGRIRVGAIPTIAPYLLPQVLRTFRDSCPQAKVTVTEETTVKLLHRLQQGEVDLAFVAAPISGHNLQTETLFDEELHLVVPAGHPLANQRQIAPADLRDYHFVLLDETHCLSDSIASFCRQSAYEPLSVERTSQLATVAELATLGHGISLIPQMARAPDTSDRRVYRSLKPAPTRSILLAWNPYRFQSQLTERFRQVVRDAVRAMLTSTTIKRSIRSTAK